MNQEPHFLGLMSHLNLIFKFKGLNNDMRDIRLVIENKVRITTSPKGQRSYRILSLQ